MDLQSGRRGLRAGFACAVHAAGSRGHRERALVRELRTFMRLTEAFAEGGIAPVETFSRLDESLSAAGWDLSRESGDPLCQALRTLLHAAQRPTQLPTLFVLNHPSLPPGTADFLVAHEGDFAAACAAVKGDLQRELRRPFGPELRYA